MKYSWRHYNAHYRARGRKLYVDIYITLQAGGGAGTGALDTLMETNLLRLANQLTLRICLRMLARSTNFERLFDWRVVSVSERAQPLGESTTEAARGTTRRAGTVDTGMTFRFWQANDNCVAIGLMLFCGILLLLMPVIASNAKSPCPDQYSSTTIV